MSGCVLRIKGKDLIIPSSLEVLKEFDEGVNINVSDSEEFDVQLSDAIRLLRNFAGVIESLASQKGYKSGSLDFGVFEERKWSKSYGFSTELVSLASALNLDLMVSIYAPENA